MIRPLLPNSMIMERERTKGGETTGSMETTENSPFRNFVRTADRIGFKHIITAETDGTASTMNDALTQAVKDKPNMVMLSGNINKDTVVTNIELAQANGIEVVSAGTTGCEQPDHFVDYTVPIPYENVGALMELSQTIFRGFKKEFEQYVSADDGNCTVINANAIELGNGLTNKIKTILENDRKINYIFVFDDAAITDAVSSVVQTSSSAKIVATGGKPEDFNYAQSGSIDMLVAHSYEWTAYAMVDYILRIAGGLKLPEQQDVPFRVLTKDIINKAIDDSDDSFDTFDEICFGSNFVTGYNNLWNY